MSEHLWIIPKTYNGRHRDIMHAIFVYCSIARRLYLVVALRMFTIIIIIIAKLVDPKQITSAK